MNLFSVSRLFFSIPIGFVATLQLAIAAAVPVDIQAALKPLKPHTAAFDAGVVAIEFHSTPPPSINNMRNTALMVLCHRVNMSPQKPWGADPVKGIEIWNQGKQSGFALMVSARDCLAVGAVPAAQKTSFLQQRTWVCVARNPCRARRAGETTAMDS
jgi:hypothetical protein